MSNRRVSLWLPVVLWAALIFALSSIPSLSSGLGTWDLVLRKLAHVTEFAVLGALLMRALGRELPALAVGVAYAISDEVHQHFVAGRSASVVDAAIDAVRRARRDPAVPARAAPTAGLGAVKAVAVDFDGALGDTQPLWRAWLEDAARRYRIDGLERLVDTPQEAEAQLDVLVGNWRALLERYAEEHVAVYLRPRAEASAALRRLQGNGVRVAAFTDAPEPLARVAAAQLGVARRLDALEAGAGALERLLGRLGEDTRIVRTLDELVDAAN